MPDLISIADDLKNAPDQWLTREAQKPTGTVPTYLVLSELNRRQTMRAAAQQRKPQTSVYEDVLQSMQQRAMPMAPQGAPPGAAPGPPPGQQPMPGGLGGMPPGPGAVPPGNFPTPQPQPMGMARGGPLKLRDEDEEEKMKWLLAPEMNIPAYGGPVRMLADAPALPPQQAPAPTARAGVTLPWGETITPPEIKPFDLDPHRREVQALQERYLQAPRPSSDEEIAAERARMEKLYGKPRDYDKTLGEIAQLEARARQQMQPNTGRTLFDMGSAMLASESPYAGVAVGRAAQYAAGQHQARTEQGRENLMQALQARQRIEGLVDEHKLRVNQAVDRGVQENAARSQKFNEMLYQQGINMENANFSTKQQMWELEQRNQQNLQEKVIAAKLQGMDLNKAISIENDPHATPEAKQWARGIIDTHAEVNAAKYRNELEKQKDLARARGDISIDVAKQKKELGLTGGGDKAPPKTPITDMQTTARSLIDEQIRLHGARDVNQAKEWVIKNLQTAKNYTGDPIIDQPGARERLIKYVRDVNLNYKSTRGTGLILRDRSGPHAPGLDPEEERKLKTAAGTVTIRP
jgi:hypothetical protein